MASLLDGVTTLLFDFDGLLVNTEQLHYEAYKQLVESKGHQFDIDFLGFAAMAHTSSSALREYLLNTFPSLNDTPWEMLYAEKQALFLSLLTKENLEFMPGADAMIEFACEEGKTLAVVTNSSQKLTDTIRGFLPLLNDIPHWITRECYALPKPAPDGYLTALDTLGVSAEHALGFEDSLRGARSLVAAHVTPIMVCDPSHPQMKDPQVDSMAKYETFIELLEEVTEYSK